MRTIASNFVIAEATMAPSQLIFDKKQELKNKFFKQIAQDFILVKIKNVFANNKLDIEISLILSNLKWICMPKNWESLFHENKSESDNANCRESDPSKIERDNFKNFEQNDANLKKNPKLFNSDFLPHFFWKTGFCSQRPFKFKAIRFDKTMSRTSRLLALNLGGRGYRFNMTLESKISRFKINKINR
jgi:hypothetical protein